MKGLAKRNNKTRGKTVRRRKNNRKTIRKGKKRGGAGVDNIPIETSLPEKKAELMYRRNKAKNTYQEILNRTADEFYKLELDFVQFREQTNNKTGYAETKNEDENQHPTKKLKYNDPDETIAAAVEELEEQMKLLNNEREIATTKYKEEIESIESVFSFIKQKVKEQQETAYINAKKDRKIEEAKIKNKEEGKYLSPLNNGTVFNVDQATTLTSQALQDYHDNLANHIRMEDEGLTFNGGKKRKTHKKRK